MQNPDILAKMLASAYSTYDYEMPDGTIVQIQGYENLGLDISTQTCLSGEIIVGGRNIGSFPYMYNGEIHHYFPDFYIPGKNIIVEIKSDYTLNVDFDINMAKFAAVVDAGYIFHLMVFDGKGELVIDEMSGWDGADIDSDDESE